MISPARSYDRAPSRFRFELRSTNLATPAPCSLPAAEHAPLADQRGGRDVASPGGFYPVLTRTTGSLEHEIDSVARTLSRAA
jgi:hypothetical protein